MKIADTHSLFIALIWMILFSSCSDENNTPDINGKEIWIGLQIGPSLEYDSQPGKRVLPFSLMQPDFLKIFQI